MRRSLTLTRPIRISTAVAFAGALAFGSTIALAADQPTMGTAANYAVIGASTITNTGPTVINGNMALSPGTSVTGFLPGVVTGDLDVNNAPATLAQTDLVTAYDDAAGETTTVNLTGTDLGGLTLTPGTYTFDTSALLTGTLTLDGEGATNPVFIFQIGSTLTTASSSSVALTDGASGCGIYWQVGSSATLGTTTSFQGTIMAMTSITMNTGATIGVGGLGYGGRALAMNGAVTLDSNIITPPAATCVFTAAPTPTPVPTAVPTAAPTAVPTAMPTAVPTSPEATNPAAGTPAPTTGATVPVFNVPGIDLFPGLPGVPGATGIPDTRLPGPVESSVTAAALVALAGMALLVATSVVSAARRRRA